MRSSDFALLRIAANMPNPPLHHRAVSGTVHGSDSASMGLTLCCEACATKNLARSVLAMQSAYVDDLSRQVSKVLYCTFSACGIVNTAVKYSAFR